MAKFKVGQRLLTALPLRGLQPDKTPIDIPSGSTVEVTHVHDTHSNLGLPVVYDFTTRFYDALSSNGVAEATFGGAAESHLTYGRGRPMFPGERPPKKGTQFGITGQNNDYAKLAKQGRRAAPAGQSTPASSASSTPSPDADMTLIAKGANGPSAAPPSDLSEDQAALLDTSCPECGTGTLEAIYGNFKKGPHQGKPYAIMACTDCGARVRRDGEVVPKGGSVAAPAAASAAPAAAAAPKAAKQKAAPADSSEVATESTVKVEAPAAPKVVKPTFVFPTKLAMKVAADVRKMAAQGSTEMTFSLRKLLAWGTASHAFASSGVPDNDAVAAGFRITTYDRETEESQGSLATLFQSVFGFNPTANTKKHPALNNDEIIEMALTHKLNLWLSGPTGCGKTFGVLSQLKAKSRKFIRVQGGGDVTRETLVGYAALHNGSSTFKAGPLVFAMEQGIPLLLDEIDKLRDEVLSELTAVLEGNSLILMDDGGREVAPKDGFAVIATANTVGRGEGIMYGGTRTVNEALRDRFVFLSVDYDNERDSKILDKHLKALNSGV